MSNLKFIGLHYLAAKKSEIWDFGLKQIFLRLVHKQSLSLEGNALQTSYRVQQTQV